MKKVVLANDLKDLFPGESFLDRADIKVYLAATNDDVLKLHREKQTDLIIVRLEMPGIRSEELFAAVRKNEELRHVSVIMVCNDSLAHRERAKQCRANAVFTAPVDASQLHLKVQQFLNVSPRISYRGILAVAIEGKFRNRPLPFWTENIRATGLLIRTEEPLARGAGIFFSFFLPDGTHVSGYGDIVRAVKAHASPDTFLFGVKFTNVDPEAKAAIEATVKKRAQERKALRGD